MNTKKPQPGTTSPRKGQKLSNPGKGLKTMAVWLWTYICGTSSEDPAQVDTELSHDPAVPPLVPIQRK